MKQNISQEEIVKEFYRNNPSKVVAHPEAVDWITAEYRKRTGKVFRDPDRQIRKLAQEGFLIKISKGKYMHNPGAVESKVLEEFSQKQKEEIYKRDCYRCVICGKGREHGIELHVDHIKPKDLGGTATIENGQILCAQHNFQKKTFKQTETGKKMFIRLYELAKKDNNTSLLAFCRDILQVFDKHDINGHIDWEE